MSRSSLTKSRLLHISDLPSIQRYSSIDINLLLPIHYDSLKENVLTMIHYERQNFTQKILVHDPNLALNSTNYSQIRGGWCQDFDRTEDSTGLFVKKSIQTGVVILNYLQAICQARIHHNHRSSSQQPFPSANLIIKSQSTFYITQRQSLFKNLSSSQSSNILIPSTHNKTNMSRPEPINLQTQCQCYQKQEALVIAYNIYKKSGKYIFLTGVNQCPTESFFNTMTLFRNWNLSRVKITKSLEMKFDKLYRISSYLQHVFSISRGFIFSTFQSRQFTDPFLPLSDLNDNKKHLNLLLRYFDIQKDLQNSSQLIFQQIRIHEDETVSTLEDTFKLYRFCFTYKFENQSNEEKSSLVLKLMSQFSRILGKILASLPINIGVSYKFEAKHNQNTNQLTLLMIFNFKSSLTKHIYLSAEQAYLALKNLTQYLSKESYTEVQKAQKNVADEVFKSSYIIFNKYSQTVDNSYNGSDNKQLKDKFSKIKLSTSHLTQPSGQKRSQSNQSQYPTPIKSLIPEIPSKPLSQTSTLFSKSQGYSQIQLQYKKLISSLQQRPEILNPNKVKSLIKAYLLPFHQIYSSLYLTKDEKKTLYFVGLACEKLTVEDLWNLILKYEDSIQAITEFFMQESNLSKIIELAKYFTQKIQALFKQYLNESNGFKSFRYNVVVIFLKKIIQKYCLKVNPSNIKSQASLTSSPIRNYSKSSSPQKPLNQIEQKFTLTQISMQDLIFLLQNKGSSSPQYKNLISTHLSAMFLNLKQTPFVSQILYHFYIHLINSDHHQDLVISFIAEILFQISYWTTELTSITLNNNRYRKNVVNLRQKKLLDVVRQNGFITLGYQLRGLILPQLMKYGEIVLYEHLIISTVHIYRVELFHTVISMIQNTFFSQRYIFLHQILKRHKYSFNSLSRSVSMPIYNAEFSLQNNEQFALLSSGAQQKDQIEDPLLNIDMSQSGIFKDLLSLNPNIKIAGKSLKEQYSRKLKAKQEDEKKFTLAYFFDKIVTINTEEAWEYIQLAKLLKDKVIEVQQVQKNQNYLNIQSSVQKDLIYIKQTFQHIYSKLSKIYQYIALSDILYEIQKTFPSIIQSPTK